MLKPYVNISKETITSINSSNWQINSTKRTPFSPEANTMPDSKQKQKGNNMDPSCPKPVFASASKHLNSVNTKPLPVCLPCSQLGHSKQLMGKLQRSRDTLAALWQCAPSTDLSWLQGHLGFIHGGWLKSAGCLQDFWRGLNICNFF